MRWQSKIQVLRAFQPMARSLTIYNTEHFSRLNRPRAIGQNLLQAAGYTTLAFSLIIVLVLNLLAFGNVELEWHERAFHLGLMLGQMQQLFIFAAMSRKNRQITNALEKLQRTVTNRKESNFFQLEFGTEIEFGKSKVTLSPSIFSQHKGLSQSYALYEQIEQRFTAYLNVGSKIFIWTIAINNGLPLLQPIFYMIFSRPEPSQWTLPNGFRYDFIAEHLQFHPFSTKTN